MMQNTTVMQPLTALAALQSVLENSFAHIVPSKKEEFERRILDLEVALIEDLGRQTNSYCNGGWEEIRDQWRELHNKYERLQIRRQLLHPVSPKEFDAAIRWMAGRGMEKELALLEEVKKKASPFPMEFSPEKINALIDSAQQRIRERLSDPDRVVSEGELTYQRNKEVWDQEYAGEFIAIWNGEVVVHDRDEAEVARKLSELQRHKEPFRAYVVEVGSPNMTAHGPHGGAHRMTRTEDTQP